MSLLSLSAPRPSEGWAPYFRRMLHLIVAIGLALGAGLGVPASLQSPGQTIRSELDAAAAPLQSPSAAPSERLLAELRHDFRDREAAIDATSWPRVSITLRHVDAATCQDAAAQARRIEGLVVIALEGYATAKDCGLANDMTWDLMP
jgi:hypothetical protein